MLSEAVEAYLAMRQARRISPTTITNEGYVLRRMVVNIGDMQVRNLRAHHIERWFYDPSVGVMTPHTTRDGQVRPGVSENTHNYYLARLASLCRYLVSRGWTRDDLMSLVRPMKVDKRVRFQPTPSMLVRMLDVADNERDRALLAVVMGTGCRAGELLRMTVGDVDLATQSITVWVSKSKVEDLMPLPSDTEAEIRSWLTAYAEQIPVPLAPEHCLFPSRVGSRYSGRPDPVTGQRPRTKPSWVPERPMHHPERVVKEALARVGVPDVKGEGMHTIRRAMARAMFDQLNQHEGYDGALRVVSAWLHHASVTVTEGYLGMTREREQRDLALRGKPFLSAMVARENNVIPLSRRA